MYVCVYGSVYNSPCLWEGCVCLCTGSSCVGVGYCFQREDFVVGCSVCVCMSVCMALYITHPVSGKAVSVSVLEVVV